MENSLVENGQRPRLKSRSETLRLTGEKSNTDKSWTNVLIHGKSDGTGFYIQVDDNGKNLLDISPAELAAKIDEMNIGNVRIIACHSGLGHGQAFADAYKSGKTRFADTKFELVISEGEIYVRKVINDKSLAELENAGIPNEIIKKVSQLNNDDLYDYAAINRKLENILGEDNSYQKQVLEILNNNRKVKINWKEN